MFNSCFFPEPPRDAGCGAHQWAAEGKVAEVCCSYFLHQCGVLPHLHDHFYLGRLLPPNQWNGLFKFKLFRIISTDLTKSFKFFFCKLQAWCVHFCNIFLIFLLLVNIFLRLPNLLILKELRFKFEDITDKIIKENYTDIFDRSSVYSNASSYNFVFSMSVFPFLTRTLLNLTFFYLSLVASLPLQDLFRLSTDGRRDHNLGIGVLLFPHKCQLIDFFSFLQSLPRSLVQPLTECR